MEIKKFKNHFLVAMPGLNDSIFKKSIILLCEHNIEGSMGLIINKPIDIDNMLLMQNQNALQIKDSKISVWRDYFDLTSYQEQLSRAGL